MADDAWTVDQYLAAEVADRLGWLYWVTQNKDLPRSKRSKEPERLSRPADERKRRERAEFNAAQARKFRAIMAARARTTKEAPPAH